MGTCGRRPKLTGEQEAELVGLALGGMGYAALGVRFGVSVSTVQAILTRHGARKKDRPDAVDGRRRRAVAERDEDWRDPRSTLSEGEWREVMRRWLAGKSAEELAAEKGVSVGAISWQATDRGLRKRDVEGAVIRRRRGDAAPGACAKLGFVFDPADPARSLGELGGMAAVAAAEGRTGDYTTLLALMRSTRNWVGKGAAEAAATRNGGCNPGEPFGLHAAQRPPEGRWATWLFLGGRGAGKTLAGARWLHDRAMAGTGGALLAMVGATRADVREVMVTAEANQGGEMVRSVLRNAGVTARVELRHAKVGKRERAQPVAALYEQGKVTHCGDFALMEEEMCGLGSGVGLADRVDALVWAVSELTRAGGGPRVRWLDW